MLESVVMGNGVATIGDYAFYNDNKLSTVYYCGTDAEWSVIKIGYGNTALSDAARYYYSETMPTAGENWWHYDENGEILIW